MENYANEAFSHRFGSLDGSWCLRAVKLNFNGLMYWRLDGSNDLEDKTVNTEDSERGKLWESKKKLDVRKKFRLWWNFLLGFELKTLIS